MYKNNARALLSRILSIVNSDWMQHASSVCGVYEYVIKGLATFYYVYLLIFSFLFYWLILIWFDLILVYTYILLIHVKKGITY